MYLIIDVGNTRVKVAVFDTNTIIFQHVFNKKAILSEVSKIIDTYPIRAGIISAVAALSTHEQQTLHQLFELMELDHTTKVPFVTKYQTPATLGADRIALASAGVVKYPQKDVLIIDAGTCITFDFVNAQGEYLGGAISPGIRLRYKALHDYTSKLPLLETQKPDDFIGNTTTSSIHSGVVNGVLREIDGVIHQYKQLFKDLTVVLTGGDTIFLAKQLKNTIFANPNFIMEGLYTILIYNKAND